MFSDADQSKRGGIPVSPGVRQYVFQPGFIDMRSPAIRVLSATEYPGSSRDVMNDSPVATMLCATADVTCTAATATASAVAAAIFQERVNPLMTPT